MKPIVDTLQRPLEELRISLTDRCNFRCAYCMPKTVFGADYPFLPAASLLSFEEIVRLARVFAGLGVRKIRLTGGEPLLRPGIERLIETLAALDVELTLTTNGARLAAKAQGLFDAGLTRLTVSLDAIDDAIFRAMNGVGFGVADVLAGIDAAADAGFAGIKINMVVQRSVNAGQILPMARHWRERGHVLRFIEYMDVGSCNGWRLDEVVSAREIVGMIGAEYPLELVPDRHRGETAQRWRYLDAAGEIGVIASVTEPFCGDCTRARLSADGRFYTCLFASHGVDLRGALGAGDEVVAETIRGVWQAREDRYSEERGAVVRVMKKVEMSFIGG